jgi:hypothetical protein
MTPSPTPTPTPSVTPSPVVTPTPYPSQTPASCPVGYIGKIFGSTIVCVTQEQTQNQTQNNTQTQNNNNKQEVNVTVSPHIENTNNNNITVNGSGSTSNSNVTINTDSGTRVAGVSVVNQVPTYVKELPKTGLPLAAMAFTALFPAASRFRKMGQKSREEETPNSIWMKKQLH